MPEAKKSIDVNVPIEVMWKVVIDMAAYPEFLKQMKKVKVLSDDAKSARIDAEIEMIKSVTYTMDFKKEPPTRLSWTLVKSNLMKENTGSWVLEKLGPERTRATYSVSLKLNLPFVPQAIIDGVSEGELPKMLEAFKARAEKIHKG
jgi:coenzyme Q-binding protein COQ10